MNEQEELVEAAELIERFLFHNDHPSRDILSLTDQEGLINQARDWLRRHEQRSP